MLDLIAQHGDFSVYTFDHKCCTHYDLGGGITDALAGNLIVRQNEEEVFRCVYGYEAWNPSMTLELYRGEGIYTISQVKTILKSIPKTDRLIIEAVLGYKKNEFRY